MAETEFVAATAGHAFVPSERWFDIDRIPINDLVGYFNSRGARVYDMMGRELKGTDDLVTFLPPVTFSPPAIHG